MADGVPATSAAEEARAHIRSVEERSEGTFMEGREAGGLDDSIVKGIRPRRRSRWTLSDVPVRACSRGRTCPQPHRKFVEAICSYFLKNAVRHREHRGNPELHRDSRSLSRRSDVHLADEFGYLMIDYVNRAL